MKPSNDHLKHFGSLKSRNLRDCLAKRIAKEFPRFGGERITQLCADMILEVVAEHLKPSEHVRSGQVRWLAIHKDCPPQRFPYGQGVEHVCVTLDLIAPEDIDARIAGRGSTERLLQKALRLCKQAYEQKALLSNSDLAELLCVDPSYVGHLLSKHERETQSTVPRRATLHDVGTALSHKGIICRKRYLEGKESNQIARETYHSLQAVDRYLGQFERVRTCARLSMTPQRTAHILNCSERLVEEYLKIHHELEEGESCSKPA